MKNIKKFIIITAVIICSFLVWSHSQGAFLQKDTRTVFAMNTQMELTIYADNEQKVSDTLNAIQKRIEELDSLLSVTNENSEIYAVNHRQNNSVKIGKDAENIINNALEISRQTDGALDISIYPVLRAWGFTTNSYQVPSAQILEKILPLVDYRKIAVKDGQITLPEGMEIDLGAVAKGYTGDEIVKILKDEGISSAIINLGGNVQALGTKPDGSLWKVGLQDGNNKGYIGTLEIADCAVVTSGLYEKFFVDDNGIKHGHIIDPATGMPVDNDLTSVTIIGKQGIKCDALSTALFVLGKDKAIEYWREHRDFEMILQTKSNEIYLTKKIHEHFKLDDNHIDTVYMVVE